MKNNRVESLDYLRGLMALSVMFYHYYIFSSSTHEINGLLGKLGIYAVSTFYVLSGLSLALVYQSKLSSFNEIVVFIIKRIFRIFPVMWLATSIAIVFAWIGILEMPNWETILLNYSLFFGFIKIDAYITTGAWSIGNEMVFYSFFPIMMLLALKSRYVIFIFLTFSCLVALVYSFFIFNSEIPLSLQWVQYINPFNQIYLFIVGVTIGLLQKAHSIKNKKIVYFSIILTLILIYFPTYNTQIDLLTNWNRIYYSLLFIFLCYLFFVGIGNFNNLFGKSFRFFGEVSYSIYLLHPLIAIPVGYIAYKYGIDKLEAFFYIAVPLTLVSSYISYSIIERPMIKIGKSIENKIYLMLCTSNLKGRP